jgi:uncharacterized protein YbjT (DUF2867 family)
MSGSVILVTGATGQQGGAVARHLLEAGFAVRIVVRNPESPASRALVRQGAEAVPGDFANPESLRRAMSGVRGVFSVQPFLPGKADREMEWGMRVADVAATAGVSHFVYTSVLAAGMVCKQGRDREIYPIHRIASHDPATRRLHGQSDDAGHSKRISKGKLTAPNAVDCAQPLIAVDDIGAIAAKVFAAPETYLGQTMPLVGDVVSTRTQAETLSRLLARAASRFDSQDLSRP